MASSILKILRSITPGSRPTGQLYGTPYVNFGDNQIGVFNSSNVAVDLIGVPVFSASVNYTAGQAVSHGGLLYVAPGSVSAGAWNPAQWFQVVKPTVPTVRTFLSAGSGTYTTPAGCTWIRVKMVGGGGGGASGGVAPGNGGNGGNSVFGLHTATGGQGAALNQGGGGSGAVIGAGGVGMAIQGGGGQGSYAQVSGNQVCAGGTGGNSALGGGAVGANYSANGGPGGTNTGGGGGGGGGANVTGSSGPGGGAAGYLDIIIVSPVATYSYTVGAAGVGNGGAGTQTLGGNGAVGGIWVEEHYN